MLAFLSEQVTCLLMCLTVPHLRRWAAQLNITNSDILLLLRRHVVRRITSSQICLEAQNTFSGTSLLKQGYKAKNEARLRGWSLAVSRASVLPKADASDD